jgi:hypothetical protein
MGVVLEGGDTDLRRDLASKILLDRLGDNPAMVCRFIEEVRIASQLQQRGEVRSMRWAAFRAKARGQEP